MSRRVLFLAGLLGYCPIIATAHDRRIEPETWHQAWDGDPLVLLSLGTLTWLYSRGVVRIWQRTGSGSKASFPQAASFYCSLVVVLIALLSPLDALSDELSSCHMIQHMLLITFAAPLFVIGSPALVLSWGLPELWRRRGGTTGHFLRSLFRTLNTPPLWQPLAVWMLFAVTLWGWHHPLVYQTALRDPAVHDAQHLSFFVVACLFWRICLDPVGRRRISPIVAVPYLFATSVQTSALGVFLALSPSVWYDEYVTRTPVWGLTPMEDQQLAGLIMWMPACLVYPLVAVVLFGRWMSNLKNRPNERAWPRPIAVAAGR